MAVWKKGEFELSWSLARTRDGKLTGNSLRTILCLGALCFSLIGGTVEALGEDEQFVLQVGSVLAWAGEQHVRVPVFLSSQEDSVGAWEILMRYDRSGGAVVSVELCDSAYVDDPEYQGWHYAPWHPVHGDSTLRPEYFTYQLKVDGHPDWVRIVGAQDLDTPRPDTPGIPPGQLQLFFCLIFDVSPILEGPHITFGFHTRNCVDNTLTSSDGTIRWGPSPSGFEPQLACPERPEELRVIKLIDSHAVGILESERGDVNCDGVPYSVADATMFISYLVHGDDALQDGNGQYYCDSFEAHCYAANIDEDGYCFTIADLILLIRVINGYEIPPSKREPGQVTVSFRDGIVSTDADVGAMLLTFDGRGEVYGDGVAFGYAHGQTKVLAYQMEDRLVEAGPLFSIFGDVRLIGVEAADFFGGPMVVKRSPGPSAFALAQNYPNPFNSITEIAYDLPVDCQVRLAVYNVIGQRVATVVDEHQEAGHKTVRWDSRSVGGVGIASGIYFCRIQAGEFSATERMVFVR